MIYYLLNFLFKNRLYGENHKKNSSIVLKDVVVNAIMSNYSIGPKLYGIFPAGRLEELIPVRKRKKLL